MSEVLWIFYIFTGFVIAIPLLQIGMFKVDKRYKSFVYVSSLLFLWWFVDLLRFVCTNPTLMYYLSMLIYPLVYLIVFSLFVASLKYLGKPLKKHIVAFGIIVLIINFVISFTNDYHNLVLYVNLSDTVTLNTFREAEIGPLYMVFLSISYILILGSVGSVLYRLSKRIKENKDPIPFVTLILSLAFGFFLNLWHVLVDTFEIDPTIVSVTAFISVLYYVFYIRDLRLILAFDRHNFLINNLNENFVISNDKGVVVVASDRFIEMTGIDINDHNLLEDLLVIINEKAVMYENTNDVKYDYSNDKMYLKTSFKEIRLPVYKKRGSFYLFTDETANLKYINEMNYVKTHDLMTNLYNRNYLEEIRDSLDDEGHMYHIIMFDLDGLKLFNDIMGHEKGDDLLIRFAKQLLEVSCEEGIIPIRLGGDEFVIITINKSDKRANRVVDEIKSINDNLEFINTIHYSYAIESNKGNKNMTEVLSEADKNMYKMKRNKTDYKEKLKDALTKIKNSEN